MTMNTDGTKDSDLVVVVAVIVVVGWCRCCSRSDRLVSCREKLEDYLRFLTHAGETRFPIFA